VAVVEAVGGNGVGVADGVGGAAVGGGTVGEMTADTTVGARLRSTSATASNTRATNAAQAMITARTRMRELVFIGSLLCDR
jgi:hypothetical protein